MASSPADAAARLAAIVEFSDDAIVSKDLNGIVTSWNRAAARMFGYAAEEAIGQSIRLIIPNERWSEEDQVLARIRTGQSVDHFETVRRRKDGTLIQISLTVSPIRAVDGTVIGASKIARDITERKRAEAALTELDHRLLEHQRALREAAEQGRRRALFLAEAAATLSASLESDKTLAGVARLLVPRMADWCAVDVLDDDGRLQRVAVAHADETMTPLVQTLAESVDDGRSPISAHEVVRTGRSLLLEQTTAVALAGGSFDHEHRRALRELDPHSCIRVPLTSHSRPFGAITLARSTAGRPYSRDDLSLAEELAALASLAVENARAYARANQANRLKDQFLATLSHELRTPLSAILGYTRLLRLGKLAGEREAPALEVVERNALSLKQIIEDVLDVSRIAAGKLRLNVGPVRLPDIVVDALTTVRPAADAKGVRIDVPIDDESVPPVSGDRDRLRQVVWNLLSNAVKFTPRGGVVRVQFEQQDSHLEVAVADNGQGVNPSFLPHMFERFRQADSSFSRQQGGLGLGLAIVRELVEMHGGTVKAESEGPGTGTTIRVRLPLMQVVPALEAGDALGAPPSPAVVTAESSEWSSRLIGVRVVIVDDDDDAVGLLAGMLQAAGAEVRTARSAAGALAEVEREVPDVLVSDIGMPGMDGLELIRRLRQSPVAALQTLPALALTAYARMEDRITALASGYHMHMAKPADPAELVLGVAALARRPDRTGDLLTA